MELAPRELLSRTPWYAIFDIMAKFLKKRTSARYIKALLLHNVQSSRLVLLGPPTPNLTVNVLGHQELLWLIVTCDGFSSSLCLSQNRLSGTSTNIVSSLVHTPTSMEMDGETVMPAGPPTINGLWSCEVQNL